MDGLQQDQKCLTDWHKPREKKMKVRCIRNTSTALHYIVGAIYRAVAIPGGLYEIRDGQGSAILAPLEGHYLTFLPIEK